jgi:hypothetical protein
MRTAIQPDRSLLCVGAQKVFDGDDCLGAGIDLFRDPNANGSPVDIGRDVRAALMFGKREARRIPTVGVLSTSRVYRNSEIVAELWPWAALGLILVKSTDPISVQETLCRDWRRAQRKSQQRDE